MAAPRVDRFVPRPPTFVFSAAPRGGQIPTAPRASRSRLASTHARPRVARPFAPTPLAPFVAMTVPSVGKILNEAQISLAVHKKCVKQMLQRRHADVETFLPELCNCILPVLLEFKVRGRRYHEPRRGPRGTRGGRDGARVGVDVAPRVATANDAFSLPPERGPKPPPIHRARVRTARRVSDRGDAPGIDPRDSRRARSTPAPRRLPPSDPRAHAPPPHPLGRRRNPSSSERPLFAIPPRTHLNPLQRDLCAERVVRFIVSFTATRAAGLEEESDDFAEAFLGFLLNLATAKDKAVRFRVCQVVAGVLNSLGADAEISDDLYERMEAVMLERLRDKVSGVRAQAARALSRLQDGGQDGSFADDAITHSFVKLLGAEKNKDVRKAILGSLAISDFTIPHVVERTRDASEDVRRVAFLALASKVPVDAISIALRATAARRGLNERAPSVRAAAVEMLKRWHEAFEGDVLALLAALDVETNEAVGEMVVRELIACGKMKPKEISASTANGNPPGGGLRRDVSAGVADPDALMKPEAAVYWRVVCESLHREAQTSQLTAATAVGQNQVVNSAAAGELLEALEAALPASAVDLLLLVKAHAEAGARFVARQLLALLALVDLADATARRGAATLVDQQLRAKPSSADDVHLDVAGAQSSYALGGSGEWERALVSAARLVRDSPADAARAVLGAAEHLRLEHDDDASCRAQSLFLTSLLLESAPARSLDDETVEATMANLVRPGLANASASVRKEAVRALGLLGILCAKDGAPSKECVRVLRAALAADAPSVRCVAAKALGDLALLHGPAALDATTESFSGDGSEGSDDNGAPGMSLLTCTLEAALLSVLDENPGPGFDALDENAPKVSEVDVTGGAALAEAEAEGCPGTAVAEALVKLILRRGAAAFAPNNAHIVVAKLVTQFFAADVRVRPRLTQCLSVFFPALAAAPVDRRRLVCLAALPTLRAHNDRKGIAKIASYFSSLMNAGLSADEALDANVNRPYNPEPTMLAVAVAEEALAVASAPIAKNASVTEKALRKAYIAALANVALSVSYNFTRVKDAPDYDQKSVLAEALARGAEAAESAAAMVNEKIASKNLGVVAEKMRAAREDDAFENESAEDEGAAVPAPMIEPKESEEAEEAEEAPETAEAAPATAEAGDDEAGDLEEAGEEAVAPEAEAEPAKRASRKKPAAKEKPAAKTTRASRRGAPLRENVAH